MDSQHYFNPYTGQTFVGFFITFFERFWQYLTGAIALNKMASDEIQMIVMVTIAVSTSIVGVFLVLRKMTMLANSLSHTILLGIVVVYLAACHGITCEDSFGHGYNMSTMLLAALAMGVLTSFLTEFLTKSAKLQEDASIGIAFTSLFAIGVILLTLTTRNAHIGTEVVMGNVDALQQEDIRLSFFVMTLNIAILLIFFKEYKITTFDPGLANSLGISVLLFNNLLMIQTSITAVGAFRSVGVLMVLSLITGPPLTARLLTDDLKKMMVYAVLIGSLASVAGIALARHFLTIYEMPLSTGGIIVCVISLIYFLTALKCLIRQRISKFLGCRNT